MATVETNGGRFGADAVFAFPEGFGHVGELLGMVDINLGELDSHDRGVALGARPNELALNFKVIETRNVHVEFQGGFANEIAEKNQVHSTRREIGQYPWKNAHTPGVGVGDGQFNGFC